MGNHVETPIKLYRGDGRLTVAAPMPGLEPENISVEISGAGKMTLHGDLRGEFKGQKDVISDEWNPGPYHREIDLPEPVDGEMANVTYNNGVLVIAMPVTEKTKGARLELEPVSATHGETVGNQGHPVRRSAG